MTRHLSPSTQPISRAILDIRTTDAAMDRQEDDIELVNYNGSRNEYNQPSTTRPNTFPDGSDIYNEQDPRTVFRRLKSIHIFMITISGILGIGLYVRSGEILRLGGPIAVLCSFAILGLIAWAVMQCIAEMLCIWPVPGALIEFIRAFVDDELGIAVGVAYWFTYCITLSALITATAVEARLFNPQLATEVVVLFIIIPGILFAINSLGVALYGFVEVIGGALKILFFVVIFVLMIAINLGISLKEPIGSSNFGDATTKTDKAVAQNWGSAFFMALSIAAFQFIGVEIPAATALEARMSSRSQTDGHNQESGTVFLDRGTATQALKFSATKLPIIAGLVYFVSGLLLDWFERTFNHSFQFGFCDRCRTNQCKWSWRTDNSILDVHGLDSGEHSALRLIEDTVQSDTKFISGTA
ncbi:hypothetical protein KCU67_g4746, partial [Aureobasidium melanogenum]